MEKVLGIDIGGTSVKYGYISRQGEISKPGSFQTSTIKELDGFMELLFQVIALGVQNGLKYVGISSLGIFNTAGICIGGAENLSFLEGMDLPGIIKEKFPNLTITIMNDGNAAAVGEYWLGQGKDCSSFFCLTLGTGVGGSIVIEGKPYLGSHFRCGEIGYSNYKNSDQYFESFFSTRGILKQVEQKMNVKEIDGAFFIEQVIRKNTICLEIWNQWMKELGQLIANIILLLDVDKVIIGGGISVQKELMLPDLRESIDQNLPEMFRGETEICMAQMGNDAGMLGAVAHFFK